MNKAALVSQVTAETSTIRADAERVVGAVFSAIADALARNEPATVPASNVPSFKPAKALRDSVEE